MALGVAQGRGGAQRLGDQGNPSMKVNLTERGGAGRGKGLRGGRARLGVEPWGGFFPGLGHFRGLQSWGGTSMGAGPT